jgi:hypothetical protein
LLLSKAATEIGLTISEIAILVFGALLAFGAIGEYLEEHNRLPGCMEWPKLAFIIMVVAGLVGEFVGDAGVFGFSMHLQTLSDLELEAERGARVAIENRVAWRHLTPQQQNEIANKLQPLAGHLRAVIVYNTGDKEGEVFAREISDTLHQAGWSVSSPGSITLFAGINQPYELTPPLATGVHINAAPSEKAVVDAVVCELVRHGFDAVGAADAPPSSIGPQPPYDSRVLAINVDVRPEGPQGEAKFGVPFLQPTCP